jgi:ketosteroid isomerase-like protein
MSSGAAPVERDNKAIVQEAFDAWAAGGGSVLKLLADDATWTIVGNSPVSATYHSRQEFVDTVVRPLYARLSTPVVPWVRALYSDGDTVIAFFDGEATAKDGRPYRNTYTWYLTFRGPQVVSGVAFLDSIELTDLWTRLSPEG